MKRIKIDMDGVVAGLTEGCIAHFGWDLSSIGGYDKLRWNFFEQFGTDASVFWKEISSVEFWENLPLLEPGDFLVRQLIRNFGNDRISFLSSGSVENSLLGKLRWLRRYYPELVRGSAFCMGEKPRNFSPASDILIDDYEENHPTIIWPQPWNSAWQNRAGTWKEIVDGVIEEVRRRLA